MRGAKQNVLLPCLHGVHSWCVPNRPEHVDSREYFLGPHHAGRSRMNGLSFPGCTTIIVRTGQVSAKVWGEEPTNRARSRPVGVVSWGLVRPTLSLYSPRRRYALMADTGDLRAGGGRRRKRFGRALRVCRPSSRHLVLVKTQTGTVYTHQEFKSRSLTPIPDLLQLPWIH